MKLVKKIIYVYNSLLIYLEFFYIWRQKNYFKNGEDFLNEFWCLGKFWFYLFNECNDEICYLS